MGGGSFDLGLIIPPHPARVNLLAASVHQARSPRPGAELADYSFGTLALVSASAERRL
jgi:hypothetical protein